MKKLLLFLTLIAAVGCNYDDLWIKEEFAALEERIKGLEALCDGLNSDIKALEDIIKAVKSNDFITEVVPISKDGKDIGYRIVLESGKEICIYNGEDGRDGYDGQDGQDGKDGQNGNDGKDGYVPQIGVRQDTDGEWYWTIDGEWMLDESGNRITTTGRTDLTPMLKIEDLFWHISYDGGQSWTRLDKAVGEDGKSYFKDVREDEENVYITLMDGSTIAIAKASAFSIELEISENIPCAPLSTVKIPYTLSGAGKDAEIITLSEGLWNAKVAATSSDKGYIEVQVPAEITDEKVVVIASDGAKTIVESLTFTEGFFDTDDSVTLSEDAGSFTLKISTNFDYEVQTNASWVACPGTKAGREAVLTFTYDALPANTTTRSAQIVFKDKYCGTVKTVEVYQGSLVSLDKKQMTMIIDEERRLTATDRSGSKGLIWMSSDSQIAWVSDDGRVIAISEGTAVVTVMTADYKHTDKCTVTVGKKRSTTYEYMFN